MFSVISRVFGFLNEPPLSLVLVPWIGGMWDRGRARRRCVLFGDFPSKPQIIVPSSCLALLYHQVCGGKIEPTLTIHKESLCRTWCCCPGLIMQCSPILPLRAKLLVLSAPNTRPWARPQAGQRELSGGGSCLSWLGAEGGEPGIMSGGLVWKTHRRDVTALAPTQWSASSWDAFYSESLVD